LGAEWGRAARPGQVLALTGELGAGKTRWVRGLARGLGISARVHSPTFTLVNEYGGGRLTLYHLDLYRLETPEQILSAGVEDFLDTQGITVIEWAERAVGMSWRPSALVTVKFEITGDTERRIIYDDAGA
jgi:tRNA threonylcarbamoyladenosine biosynthesis protein TsaE